MRESGRIIMLSSYLALACCAMAMATGCGAAGREPTDSVSVALEIRLQDGDEARRSSAGVLRFAAAAASPTTFDDVARILVDISLADTGQPFFTNFELTEFAPDAWHADVPALPRDQPLRFLARALNASGEVAFSGETFVTLTVGGQSVEIPVAPAQNNQTFQVPRMFRIAYPAEMFSGQEQQFTFTIQGNAGAALGYRISAAASPSTPSPAFFPSAGTVTLTNTVADFISVFTAPDVTEDTPVEYQVTITDTRSSAIAVTTSFTITIRPRPPGADTVPSTRPSVLFNPVILGVTANGSLAADTVELVASVSDDGPPEQLRYQWTYAPNPGTPDATFAGNGLGNPGVFQGYTVAHQGTITLAVTDQHDGTTTLHYQIAPDQFADAINHTVVDGLKRIVAGDAHTCVLTGQGRVRCWGDNQFGQLGYGNTIDVGDTPSTLPFTAGNVPLLPVADPVLQLVAGNHHTCALMQSGYIYCWGRNDFGQLGYGRTDSLADGEAVTSFGFVNLGDTATRIATGGDHTCAILQSGAVRCWGRNDFGQLGRGNTENIGDDEPVYSAGNVDLGAGVTVKDLALGDSHTCALFTTGAVRCWGRGDSGQLGYGNNQNLGDDEPINNLANVSLTGPVRKLVAGVSHTCALTDAGTLRCWGDNASGQLGQILPGQGFNANGDLVVFGPHGVAWGDQPDELPSDLPSDINVGAQVTDVTAGDYHTCALLNSGQLTCWGFGGNGQLGYGGFANQVTPPTAGVNLDGVSAYGIAAGGAHTCALRGNGTVRCWGAGADGRLGRGDTITSATATGNIDIQIFAP